MSQRNVEIVIGRLATDEEMRGRFLEDPRAAIASLREDGLELSAIETEALTVLPASALEALAEALDPRLQKASLKTGGRRRRF
ncbi:MAG TPA: Os1348 family NHLP clan protein [Thermoanaerobaculia bacterium]|nr:Os1348 family NHLP clan protein [Thermoanaerobaculia bacterium]